MDQNLPSASKEAITEILALDGDFPNLEVIEHLETFLAENPASMVAKALAKHMVLQDPHSALDLIRRHQKALRNTTMPKTSAPLLNY
ncbi:MAG: hypothetical protein R2769_05765 [Saprospiraceae bacterium]